MILKFVLSWQLTNFDFLTYFVSNFYLMRVKDIVYLIWDILPSLPYSNQQYIIFTCRERGNQTLCLGQQKHSDHRKSYIISLSVAYIGSINVVFLQNNPYKVLFDKYYITTILLLIASINCSQCVCRRVWRHDFRLGFKKLSVFL